MVCPHTLRDSQNTLWRAVPLTIPRGLDFLPSPPPAQTPTQEQSPWGNAGLLPPLLQPGSTLPCLQQGAPPSRKAAQSIWVSINPPNPTPKGSLEKAHGRLWVKLWASPDASQYNFFFLFSGVLNKNSQYLGTSWIIIMVVVILICLAIFVSLLLWKKISGRFPFFLLVSSPSFQRLRVWGLPLPALWKLGKGGEDANPGWASPPGQLPAVPPHLLVSWGRCPPGKLRTQPRAVLPFLFRSPPTTFSRGTRAGVGGGNLSRDSHKFHFPWFYFPALFHSWTWRPQSSGELSDS